MRDFYKKCVFYYLDDNNKRHQITRNIILLNPYHDRDLENMIYDLLDDIAASKGIKRESFIYCRVKLDMYDRHWYRDNVKYYFNDYCSKRYKRNK